MSVAQWIEQKVSNFPAAGSNPAGHTKWQGHKKETEQMSTTIGQVGLVRRSQLTTVAIKKVETRYFRVVWLGGSSRTVSGFSFQDALDKAGIPEGAMKSLDYWEEVPPPKY